MRQAKQTLFTRIQSRQVPGLTSLPILDLGNGDLPACDLTHACQRLNEFKHLVQLVGDEDDSLPLLHQATQNTEELKCFLRGQDAGRLVHNQDVSSAVEDF